MSIGLRLETGVFLSRVFQCGRNFGRSPFSRTTLDHGWVFGDTHSKLFDVLMQGILKLDDDVCVYGVIFCRKKLSA